jgi:hypothetical protein
VLRLFIDGLLNGIISATLVVHVQRQVKWKVNHAESFVFQSAIQTFKD